MQTIIRLSKPVSGYAVLAVWFMFTVFMPRNAVAATQAHQNISVQDLLPILEDVLHDAGAPAGSNIQLTKPDAYLPGAAAMLSADHVQNISLSESSGRFLIRFTEPSLPHPITLTGFVRTPISLPVLNTAVERGDVITSDNIEWITSLDAADKYTITEQNDLEGMIARRPLKAGQAIRGRDVTKPILVSRGALITMEYQRAGLRLTHRAIANDSGGAGDVIIVRNPRTDRPVRARIFAKNRVEVIAAISNADDATSQFNR